jgi:acyl-CoA ligase (AMP-forming) (exosortase A-associated)
MTELLHNFVRDAARRTPSFAALAYRDQSVSYGGLWEQVGRVASGFAQLGLCRGDRLGIYLEKRLETVIAIFGAAAAGGVFVPINPVLKPRQVGYIMRDCNIRILVTSSQRAADLSHEFDNCPDLAVVVLVDLDSTEGTVQGARKATVGWRETLTRLSAAAPSRRVIDTDMAAILYTSGSTGNPKGVVLSHRNMVAGAKSVSQYLENTPDDRILSVLPLSFDAGLSQLTTAFAVGARVVLLNYLLPRDVLRACADEHITGVTGVPPLWIQLAELDWPSAASQAMRYFANTGGHMPRPTLDRLRAAMPKAKPYLMYGLTEAFRSTYLDPSEVDRRPDSIGKAIPNAEILVVRPDGQLCADDEPGELVHRGALVSVGYWNDPERTAERFRRAPAQPSGICLPEIAVWSGDIVRRDAEGFLYFVGRRDEMIKTSGYRVSPTEVEEVVYATGLVGAAAAIGVPHARLGQAIIVVASPPAGGLLNKEELLTQCRRNMPQYMVPQMIAERAALPRNPNGKIDRKSLATELADAFEQEHL